MWLKRREQAFDERPHRLAVSTSPRFYEAVEQSGVEFDDAQHAAIARLLDPPAHGFYLWGAVGRGKSMLSDLYYDAVPTARKRRFHFHSFFRELQTEIAATRQPVEKSINRLVGSARVVLFDEFHVHDVADAVYLTKTLDALIHSGILVLATSNYTPDDLMPNPLFHDRFIPAIALINSRFEVVPLGPGPDYRRTVTDRGHIGFGAGRWGIDLDGSPVVPHSGIELIVNSLPVRAVATESGTATFTFAELCERPLGIREYLRLAEDFDSIRLIAVPDLATAERDPLMRLCNLIDVLYDRDQQLDVQAAAAPERMIEAGQPPYDAARTLSRLSTLSPAIPN